MSEKQDKSQQKDRGLGPKTVTAIAVTLAGAGIYFLFTLAAPKPTRIKAKELCLQEGVQDSTTQLNECIEKKIR